VEVTQADWAPLVEVVHPEGKAGPVTPSKFWEQTVDTLDWPSPKGKVTVPRFGAPSCNWSEAVLVPPQFPVAMKVKGWTTAVPLVLRTPKVRGPLGERMPPVASKVATGLVVLAVPMFFKPKFSLTVSAGSTAPLGQLSAISTKLLETTLGARMGGPARRLMR